MGVYFGEKWKPIIRKSVPDIISEDAYLVSNEGRVYSNLTNSFLVPAISNNGYYRVCLRLNNKTSRYRLLHRIVALEFLENDDPENKTQVNHIKATSKIKDNNADYNLEWATPSYNIQHAYNNGLKSQYHGEDCSWATITNEQADQIGKLLSMQSYTYQQIADMINCSKSVVADIATGQNWKSIYKKYNLENIKKKFVLKLSDDDLHKICKYFEDNKYKYDRKSDLYRNALKDLFNIEYTQSMSATMSRIFNRQTRLEIINQYNF